MIVVSLKAELAVLANPEKARVLQRFFKTGIGEYGEGDVFVGASVPDLRKLAKKHSSLSLNQLSPFLKSKIHEERLTALLILLEKFNQAKDSENERKKIFDFYLKHTVFVNNWDLVDLSADKIVGAYLLEQKNKSLLQKLANSSNLWERRIAIISTFAFIKQNSFNETLKVSEILLEDNHDLIHKAVGWMLREIGKRNLAIEEKFLKAHCKKMPRTMLRYAVERFPEEKRKFYLGGKRII